jgi:hypothetical protein
LQAVRDLTTRYERPMHHHLRDHGNGHVESAADAAKTTTSWLTQHDQEYNYSCAATKYSMDNRDSSSSSSNNQRQRRPVPNADIDPEMATKAQSLMTERFGLELPEIRQSQQHQQQHQQQQQPPPQQQISLRQQLQQMQSPLHHDLGPDPPREYGQDTPSLLDDNPLSDSAATQMSQDLYNSSAPLPSSSSLMAFPPEFLANMPPHLSEIIRRKPELVQQILASRQKEAIMSAPSPVTTPFRMQQQQQQQLLGGGGGTVRTSHPSGALFTPATERRPPRLGAVAEDEEEKVDLLSADNRNKLHPEPTRSDDDGDDEWGDNDGERTTLLRNRKREPPQSKHYKSIER